MTSRWFGRGPVPAILAAAIVGLTAGPAAAETTPDAESYRCRIISITPAVPGLSVTVSQNGDELVVTNGTGGIVEVPGYTGEEYLRISGTAVEENAESVTASLNRAQELDKVAVPPAIQPPAVWKKIADANTYSWRDHRTHWMSRLRPPGVTANPAKVQLVSNWEVPLTANGVKVSVKGDLTWIGEQSPGLARPVLIGAGALLIAAVIGALFWRRRSAAGVGG